MGPKQEKVFQQLYEAYEAEKELYERLRDLSTRQFDLLSSGLQDEAVEVVREKGRLIAEVGKIEKHLEPVRREWEEMQEELGSRAEQPLADLVSELKELIQAVLEQDEESEVLLKHLTEEAADQMQQVRQGRQAAAAYQSHNRPGSVPDSCLVDRKE